MYHYQAMNTGKGIKGLLTLQAYFIIVFILFLNNQDVSAQIPAEIEDPWIIGINKLPPRTMVWPAPDIQTARNSSYYNSEWIKSLNGVWQFHWTATPQNRPVGFYLPEFDRDAWDSIPVPSTVERQGYGTPHYVNIKYPFKVNPPKVTDRPDTAYTTYKERNPVSSYCREFTIPDTWSGKQIILHFAGISSAAFIWVNGAQVGYTQGSRLPAEFNITPYLNEGKNLLAVEVYKYCDGSYLEDMDFWRLSGIFRDVFIRAVPSATLWDLYAQPIIDLKDRKGKIRMHYTPLNFTEKTGINHKIKVIIAAPDGSVLSTNTVKLPSLLSGIGAEVTLSDIQLGVVDLWDCENPVEYQVLIEHRISEKVVEVFNLPVGFRKIEVAGSKILLNNRSIKIRGVNRHEFSPVNGYSVTEEQMVEEIKLLKQGNVQFVRTSHYPNNPRWYELCNEYGIFILDEANIESHELGYHTRILPGDKAEWIYGCVDRVRRMVIRDRQMPCVIMWSPGNEAGFGNAFLIMKEEFKKNDPEQRIIQYADMNLAGDLDSQTYPTISWLKQHLRGEAKRKGERGEPTHEHQHGPYPSGRPFIMNEYCHAMGNSLGNISDYWDLIYAHDTLTGGFIWDWIDQALYRDPENPLSGFVYGGDFGDHPTDKNMCVNGIIGADLKIHPHYMEMQKVYQPLYLTLKSKDPLIIEITNHALSTNSSEWDCTYQLMENGKIKHEAPLRDMSIKPGERKQVNLDILNYDESEETYLKIIFSLKEDNGWARKGFIVSWEQFLLSEGIHLDSAKNEDHITCSLEEKEESYMVFGKDFKVEIDKKTGLLSFLMHSEQILIEAPLEFNFWRALTDNDRGWKVDQKMGVWKNEGKRVQLANLEIDTSQSDHIQFTGLYLFPGTQSKAELHQYINSEGEIHIAVDIHIPDHVPAPPRIGMQLQINNQLQRIKWYGRGPHENYIDRKTSAAIGIYESDIHTWITPYVRPQENANRTDVRWIEFSGSDQKLKLTGYANSGFLSVSAWPYTQPELEQSDHDYDLRLHKNIVVNIDHKQMGVGGDNSWGHPVMNKYQLDTGCYQYSYTILPIKNMADW